MKGGLKIGDSWQEWMGIVAKVVSYKWKNALHLWIVYDTFLGYMEEE